MSWEPWSFCNSESTGMYNRIAVHYNNDSQQSLYSLNMMLQLYMGYTHTQTHIFFFKRFDIKETKATYEMCYNYAF